jgi:energy-coupling factor transporter ATP-binding protein EcfA2
MNTIWFRDLGFHNNPFSIKPAAYTDAVLGYDKVVDEVSYGILNNKVIVVEGDYGNGKSTILRRILNDFGGKKQVIYYSCNRMEKHLNVKHLLNGRYGFFGKLFDMKPKDMILLLDEAQELGSKDFERLHSYKQEGYLKSIVLVGKGFERKDIGNGLAKELQDVSLDTVDEATALKIVRKRVGSLPLLPDAIIKTIYSVSEKNVRSLLKNCEEVCKRAVETGRKKVSMEFLKQVFPEELKNVKIERKVVPAKKAETKVEKKEEKKAETKPVPKKEEKKVEKKVEKKPSSKKEEVVAAAPAKGSAKVYRPDEYKDMMKSSAEELLSKPTDEIFGDEQYY